MAEVATVAFNSERLRTNGSSPLGEPVDFDVKGLGRRLPRTDAPEGWIKKVERHRQGKIWVGYFHLWVTDASGRRIRQKKEKTLGPASMPKHEAQQKLAEYIEELHRPNRKTRRRHHYLCRSVECILCRKIGPMGKENEGRSPVPFCETRYSDRRTPTAARGHSDIAAIAP